MHLCQVIFPGTRVTGPDGEAIRDVVDYLEQAARQLDLAVVALNLFESFDRSSSDLDERQEANRQARARVEARRGPEPRCDVNETHEEWLVRRRIDWIDWQAEVKREEWASGLIPQAYSHAPLTLSALGFVYAVDGIGKVLRDMMSHGHDEVMSAKQGFDIAFPDIVALRHSLMHAEERAVRRERGRPIELQGNDTPLSTGGPVFIANSFIGNRYLWTLANGRCGEIDMSVETLGRAQLLVQQAIDSFTTWEGWPQVHPY